MEIIDRAALPVYSWAPDLEEGALRQAVNCAELPVASHHVAVMADGHQGYGVPIGAVLALEDAISPYAVGNDIGCGMALVPTSATRAELMSPVPTRSGARGAVARDDIMGWIQATVPAGQEAHRGSPPDEAGVDGAVDRAYEAMSDASSLSGLQLSTSQSQDPSRGQPLGREVLIARGRAQAGTLGSGNHFLEFLSGPDDDVWVMLHSGSRGIGSLVCNNFHRMALSYCAAAGIDLPDPGLAWLPLDGGDEQWSRVGRCYVQAMEAALDYAEANRRLMLERAATALERHFPSSVRWDETVNIHHNDARRESHYGKPVWVHRKGAVKAEAGTATITPGSMGAGAYLGRGLGNPNSFRSCSHGAGRVLSRGRARRELDLRQQLEAVRSAGGKVFVSSTEAVLDEMPGAYKDLEQVMDHQGELVERVRRLQPLATYKGAEKVRRGGRHSPARGKGQ